MIHLLRGLFARRPADDPDAVLRFGTVSVPFDSLFAGLMVTGATGSGKTSFLELVTRRVLEHPSRPGALWCCVKADEAARAKRIARKAGRLRDFVHLTADGPWTIDLLGHLLGPLGQSSHGVAQFLDRLAGLAARNTGSGNDKTWSTQATALLGTALDLFRLARERVTPFRLFEVIVSVPKDVAAAAGDAFLTSTACGRLIVTGQQRHQAGALSAVEAADFRRAVEYVLGYLPGLGDRFLGSVIGTAVTGLGLLLQPPFDRLFAGPSTWTPDILWNEGAICALDLPALHGPAATVAQAAITMLVQTELLRTPRGCRRAVEIVRDEAQYLVVPDHDARVQTVARSHGIIGVTATQGVPPLVAAFGGDASARVQAETLLGSHATHVALNPGADADTRDFYSRLFGSERQLLMNGSSGGPPDPHPTFMDRYYGTTGTPTVGWSEQVLPAVPPEAFTALKRGGTDHAFEIEAYLFQAGWRLANDRPFVKVRFRQDTTP